MQKIFGLLLLITLTLSHNLHINSTLSKKVKISLDDISFDDYNIQKDKFPKFLTQSKKVKIKSVDRKKEMKHNRRQLGDSCFFANDGVCDEPAFCVKGTDSTDCPWIPVISNIIENGATAAWESYAGAASYDWEVVPTGNFRDFDRHNFHTVLPSGSGETGLTVSFTGLSSNTEYDFLIKLDFKDDIEPAVTFTTLRDVVCDDTFSFCYAGGEAKQAQLQVGVGQRVGVTINSGETEKSYDSLVIYDSLDRSVKPLYDEDGDHTGEEVTSKTGIISVWTNADSAWDCDDGKYSPISITFTCIDPVHWTGSTSSDWRTASNWDTGAVPTSSDIVEIDGTFMNEPAVLHGTDATCKDLYIATGNTLLLDETSSLTVGGDLTVYGTFVMHSTEDDFSSLIVQGTATGDITYNRFVGRGNQIGFPVGDMTIKDFINSEYSLSQYDNANGDFTPFTTGSPITCQGYAISTGNTSTADRFVAFTGTVHTTDQSVSVINNADLNFPNGSDGGGRRWNFVSNPYPSYINGNTAAGSNNFLDYNSAVIDADYGGVYMWNGQGFTIYNQLSSAFVIAPGQGFWVAAVDSSMTELVFLAAMRTTVGSGSGFYGSDGSGGIPERVPDDFGTTNVDEVGCIDENASNFDAAATAQAYDQYGYLECVYASCEDIPEYGCIYGNGFGAFNADFNADLCVTYGGTACTEVESTTATIKFTVDMNGVDQPSADYDNVVVNGDWNGWNGWGVTLADEDADGIFTGVLELEAGTRIEYVVAVTGAADGNSGWGIQWGDGCVGANVVVTVGEVGSITSSSLTPGCADDLGCIDENASNFDASATAQAYDQYRNLECVYASCEDIPVPGCIYGNGFGAFNAEFGADACVTYGGTACTDDEVAPIITSGSSGTTIAENSGADQIIYTIAATDTDGGTISSYAIGGTDAALLSVDATSGAVTLTANPNFETKSSYSFTVTAGTSAATTVTFSITCAADTYADETGACLANTVCGNQLDGTSRAAGDASRTVAGTCADCISGTDNSASPPDCDDNCLVNLHALSCAALKACNTLHCANSCGKGSMCQDYAAQWKLSSCDC